MGRIILIVFLIISVGLISFLPPKKDAVLILSPNDLERIKYEVNHDELSKNHWLKVRSLAIESIRDHSPIEIPLHGGNWPHFYVDPDEGKPLVPGKYLGNFHWEHHNQAGTKTYYGNDEIFNKDYDGVLILEKIHEAWANKLCALALAYRIEGNPEYLTRASEILSAYSKIYTRIPMHNKAGGNDPDYGTGVGRISAQALDESVWLTKMLQGMALIWVDLSSEQRKYIEANFLFPAIDMIQHCHNLGIQNISNWYNAAVGMTGYLTQNRSMIEWALHAPGRGLSEQLNKGFTSDGNWYENAPAYHFYALSPIIMLAECARNNGDPSFLPKIKRALDGPLELMMPDGNIPRFNDSKKVFLPAFSGYYAYGYSRFKDASYLPLLYRPEEKKQLTVQPVINDEALNVFDFNFLYRPKIHAGFPAPHITLSSHHLPHSGIDILYTGKSKDAVWLAAKYDVDSAKGWHVHPDALDFVLFAKGKLISPEPGCTDYGSPIHSGWYRTTLAHNALVINQKNQYFKKENSISFGITNGVKYAFCRADSAYQGVSQTRAYIEVDSSIVLIADWINSDHEATMDVVYHQRGTWKKKESGTPWSAPDLPGYRYLKNTEITPQGLQHEFSSVIEGQEVPVKILSSEALKMITGIGLGVDFETTPCMIARYKGKKLFLLWAIRLNNQNSNIQFKLLNSNEKSLVKIITGNKKIFIDPNGSCQVNQR